MYCPKSLRQAPRHSNQSINQSIRPRDEVWSEAAVGTVCTVCTDMSRSTVSQRESFDQGNGTGMAQL
jgi:hypothetical protein